MVPPDLVQGTPMELEEAKALELVREARYWAAAQKPDFIKVSPRKLGQTRGACVLR